MRGIIVFAAATVLCGTRVQGRALRSISAAQRLKVAGAELRTLEEDSRPLLSDVHVMPKVETHPSSLVEIAKAGEGTPDSRKESKSAAYGYHVAKHEKYAQDKVAPLPPPRFAEVGAQLKSATHFPMQAMSTGSNPYAFGSANGRGYQDQWSAMTGTFTGHYGPNSGGLWGSAGYGSFPNQLDPRGFGAASNHTLPYSTFFGSMKDKGVSARGFQYQVPYSPVHPFAPFTGQPFQSLGAAGPYYAPYGGTSDPRNPMQMVTNYSQFGPLPFGPYGRMENAGQMGPTVQAQQHAHKSVIPATYPFRSMGGGGGGGAPGAFPGSAAAIGAALPGGMIGAAPQTLAGAMNSQQWNPAFGMGLIPHLNSGNVFNPGSPNAQFDVLTGRMGAQSSWAANMPGVAPQYNPNVAIHHGLNLPGGMGQFKDPGMLHGFGQGYPHPDFDRYKSVFEPIPAPGGEAGQQMQFF